MSETGASLRALAHKCRCLADGSSMSEAIAALNEMAFDYDRQADRVEKSEARTRERLSKGPKPKGNPAA
jgi:hypothetical protein